MTTAYVALWLWFGTTPVVIIDLPWHTTKENCEAMAKLGKDMKLKPPHGLALCLAEGSKR